MKKKFFQGKKVLVMGLGLHGGGVETIRYLIRHGAQVTCTDLRDKKHLRSSVEALKGLDIHFVLGHHNVADFDAADIIIKNPAVPANTPLLEGRTNVETDISLFLNATDSPIIAVTGSKGKSTVVSALHHILCQQNPATRLGGNITVSPLSFVDNLSGEAPVILELSSWQLADIQGRQLLNPRIVTITNLMKDHQNRYASFADYEKDKMVIYENVTQSDWCLFPDDNYGRKWAHECRGRVILVSTDGDSGMHSNYAWLDDKNGGMLRLNGNTEKILTHALRVPGAPFRINVFFAAIMARLQGCSLRLIHQALENFAGVPHRMENFLTQNGIRYYNDTAATIPDASAAAVQALGPSTILIAGGMDKALDFSSFDVVAQVPKTILMLSGSATDAWLPRLQRSGATVEGPFDSMDAVVNRAVALAVPGDIVLLSPGAASFGMFQNEFDRGDCFKKICMSAAGGG